MIPNRLSPTRPPIWLFALFGAIFLCYVFAEILVDQTFGLCNISFLPQYREFTDTRLIENSTIPVEPLWERESGIYGGDDAAILITHNLIVVPDNSCREVVAFNRRTGEKVWRDTAATNTGRIVYHAGLNRIYVTRPSESALTAYRATDGKQLWSNKTIEERRIAMAVQEIGPDGQGYVYVSSRGIVPFNRRDGSYGEALDTIGQPVAFYDDFYLSVDFHQFSIIQYPSNDVLWRFEDNRVMRPFDEFIVFTDEILIVRIGQTVYGFDKSSGDVRWQVEDMVSNAAVYGDVVFVLDVSANLHLLQLADGVAVGNIQFEAPENPEDLETSWLAVSEDTLAIFFSDTETLSVMEIDLSRVVNE